MNAIALIAKTKITASKVSDFFIKTFNTKTIPQNDERELFLGKMPNNFYIVYDDSLSLNDSKCIFDKEIKDAIPFKEGTFNYLYFHKLEVAKEVVKVIGSVYKELIIFDDNDFIGAADIFINNY